MLEVPSWLGPLLLGVFGLLIGSFGNVVIYRLPRGESLNYPASHCPACGHPIRWYHNVPVLGWLWLRGKCADCGDPISTRYPLVEAAMGLLWWLAGSYYHMGPKTVPAIVLFTLLLLLSMIDIDVMRLPNVLVAGLFGSGLVLAAAAKLIGWAAMPLVPASAGGWPADPLYGALAGVLLGAGLSLGLAALYSAVRKADGFGMGDVKLLGAIGVFVGPYAVMVLFLASILGVLWMLPAGRLKGWREKMPFGPFIAAATVVVVFGGEPLWQWYMRLAGLA
ncbi:MAG TPA: prepilin peptidase [Coriobacteriia bacterium]|nr:prepilin peptidase [Coriobacteriia bacterium]